MSILFCVSSEAEGEPFRRRLELKRRLEFGHLRLYSGSGFELLVTGPGKLRAASALGASLELCELKLAINFGVAGSPRTEDLRNLFLINKILDQSSSKEYLSDIFIKHSFTERALLCVDQALSSTADLDQELVDMESSGFYAAASLKLGPERIQALKVVSDALEPAAVDKALVSELSEKSCETVIQYAVDLHAFLESQSSALSSLNEASLESLAESFQFSFSQRIRLRDASLRFLSQSSEEELQNLLESYSSPERERLNKNQVLNELENRLS